MEMVFYEGDSFDNLEECLKEYAVWGTGQFLELLEMEGVLDPEQERFSMTTEKVVTSGYGKVIPKTHYFLNVRRSTLIVLAAIASASYLESKIDPIPLFISLKKTLTKLNEENGEFCLVLEGMKKKTGFTEWILEENHGECINNNLECRYKREGKCDMTPTHIKPILENFQDKHICTLKNGRYKVCF